MATLKFVLLNKTDNAQIYLRFSVNRQINLRRKVGLSINAKDWSTTTNLPKTNNETNKLLKNKLERLSLFVNEQFNEDSTKGTVINNDWLTSIIDKCFNRVEKTDLSIFVNYIQYIIDNASTREQRNGKIGISVGTVKNYRMFKNIIAEYEKTIKKTILFSDLEKSFTDRFKVWLLNEKKYTINYTGKQFEHIKSVCVSASKDNITVTNNSITLKGFRQNDKERYIHTLSFDDLDKIYNTEMPTPHLKEVKKWLLIGCYIGQRGGDLLNLTSNNIRIKDNAVYFDLIQQKTEKFVTIPVLKDYVIDIILNDFPKKISLNKINTHIQKVCELAKIDEIVKGYVIDENNRKKLLTSLSKYKFITSHSFRRSFATNFYRKMPTPVLIGITGHSEEKMFLKYINQKADKDANADAFAMYYAQMMKKEEPVLRLIKSNNH
ncbi:Phage integrase family protein [Chishuiella changwenlii]|nr:phage integrase SAM-like domain-containing protein [Chishuiella changwenlii]SHL34934.1 Phage integrase family protein [Chishuiella changwenlii]